MRTISRRRTLLPLVAAVVATGAVAANAGQRGEGQPRNDVSVIDEIRSGSARKVPTRPGRDVSSIAFWHGCKFVFVTANVETYEASDGSLVEVVGEPQPLPAKDNHCVDRQPTPAELSAMRDEVNKRNANARAPGAPAPPTLPPPRR